MKKIYLFFALGFFLSFNANSQILVENFDYGTTPDTLMGVTSNWIKHSGNADLYYVTNNLTMPNYIAGNGVGGAVEMDNARTEDVHRNIGTLSGIVYYAALVKVTNPTSINGEYFIHTMKEGSSTFYGKLLAKKIDANTFNFGIGNGNEPVYYQTPLSKDVTYLVVVRFNLDDRTMKMYVFDEQNKIQSTEPTTPAAQTTVTGNALTDQNSIALRQAPSISDCIVDGLVVATQWSQFFEPNAVNDLKSTISIFPNPVQNFININQTAENVTIYNTLGQPILNSINTKSIDVSKLLPGVYFIDIKTTGNQNQIKKFIKK